MKQYYKVFLLCGMLTGIMFSAEAQKAIIFKVKYIPNRTYSSATKSIANMAMNFEGTPEQLEKLKAQGIKTPVVMDINNTADYTFKTGEADISGSFPVVITYNNLQTTMTVAGKTLNTPQNTFVNNSIYGHINNLGKIQVDSVEGKLSRDTAINKLLTTMINAVQSQIKFPEKPLKPGDTFVQDVPMNMPVSGMSLSFTIKTTYTYTGMANGLALFTFIQAANYNLSTTANANFNASGSGNGSGQLKFSVKENLIKEMNTLTNIKYKLDVKGMIIIADSKIETNLTNKIL